VMTGPGGQPGNDSVSSAAGLHPGHRLFGPATPGPAPSPRATTALTQAMPPSEPPAKKPGETLDNHDNKEDSIWRQVPGSRHIVRAAPERPFCVAGVCQYSPSDRTCSDGSGVHTVASDERHERRWPE
jgi:hypothetical protein